ncbi:hypothetical protein [Algibacter mikhailovii]|uniref:Uncharacterized protein n=1 Tax=Algibacter mikhailovii TaxID=425498 RepID=A0A918RFQ0_9FLAO|nr:hypothetical protein [Algibacter mikhailovii]GGZ95049.1 hypothetical protein GCM10007028_36450 [Algibacter mikhailovii]
MKIAKDNLSAEQKKKVYFGIALLSIIVISFFYYAFNLKKTTKELLSINTDLTICKKTGYSTYKGYTDIIKYNVNGKKYERELSGRNSVEIGEFYELKYSKSNPEFCEVNYKKPKIINEENYISGKGIIDKKYENEKWKILTFKYSYLKKNYIRDVYLPNFENYEKGKEIEIIINKRNPKISYLKQQFE